MLDLLGGGVDLLLTLLATTTQAEHEVKGRLLLDVVVGQGAAILQLLTSKDQALLVRGDTLLVCGVVVSLDVLSVCRGSRFVPTLDLGLDVVNGVGRLHLEGDSLPRQGLDEDLHLDEGLAGSVSWDAQF